jgi:hypothetical protein
MKILNFSETCLNLDLWRFVITSYQHTVFIANVSPMADAAFTWQMLMKKSFFRAALATKNRVNYAYERDHYMEPD